MKTELQITSTGNGIKLVMMFHLKVLGVVAQSELHVSTSHHNLSWQSLLKKEYQKYSNAQTNTFFPNHILICRYVFSREVFVLR